ncbi:sigma-70 family RNA polymerase sigma factor [Polaromonas sp. JS666]|uniref:sigma-70 family RNA polymerase sigma factor n=1 Tax=Polaromonas sp. (strain JS666 / ATCC BAA-500) TaxID=296591 RepID=UPI000886637B|nr:sigma-70 family RNA polymerase sigma factor [Polaromonas sp. JS666]SDN43864.1 RNA polymerase sigma-70 factor, ECF subfamily [Polaromonas sp. JS666]
MANIDPTAVFEERRRHLFGLAYRILGSRADAEDAVQDVFIKWLAADHASIETPAAWLTTLCTRHCIDMLRDAQRSRVDYVGTWLPEPIQTSTDETPETHALLASSLSMAFLLLLERLTPKERAAYLLYEIFDTPYPQIAEMLDMEEAACRKLVSRASVNIAQGKVRHVTPPQVQDGLLNAFREAITAGSTEALASLLSDDIAVCADSGGKVSSIEGVFQGKGSVLTLISTQLARYWAAYEWLPCEINGGHAIQLRANNGEIAAAITFAYNEEGKATNIYIMRNPDKLDGLAFGPEALA